MEKRSHLKFHLHLPFHHTLPIIRTIPGRKVPCSCSRAVHLVLRVEEDQNVKGSSEAGMRAIGAVSPVEKKKHKKGENKG